MVIDGPRVSLRKGWESIRKLLDLIQFGDTRGQEPPPVTLLRHEEPFLLGLNPATYEERRKVVGPREEPFVLDTPTAERRIDWSLVPDNATAVVIPARLVQNGWSQITTRVARQGLHVIVGRHGQPAAVFVPLDYLDD